MRARGSFYPGIVLAATMSLVACGGHDNRSTSSGEVATPPPASPVNAPTTRTTAAPVDSAPTHHSKLAGAAVGAVAGHMLGGHAVAGAAAGALIQHQRNKHR